MNDVPVLQDEVNRKAYDTLVWLLQSYHDDRMTLDQFSTGVDALFMAVSGLVSDPEFIQHVTQTQYLIDKDKHASTG